MEEKKVGRIILEQMGKMFPVMVGMKEAMTFDSKDGEGLGGLKFKIGKNPKSVSHVSIELKYNDTYSMTFWKVRGGKNPTIKNLGTADEVYCDMLTGTFEANTGLYTHL